MTPTELAARVREKFPDAVRISESIVQFTRRDGSRPFAVCYLDCGEDIPRTSADLQSYQDRVLGSRYFNGPKSLQWNNYLYFLTSDERLHSHHAMRIRDLMEQDRNYARKFLVGERELDQILKPGVIAPDQITEISVLSIWNNTLAGAGLGRAVWADLDMPRRLALVEAAPPQRNTTSPALSAKATPPSRPISRFFLNKYRLYPLERKFEFGAVNLIFGPNASGKTSLMEAIELFYCGRNKRSPSLRPKYDLSATFDGGSTERVTDARPVAALRQRNLDWYGQPEVQTNNLYSSFARFNFLDTDAAVRLAEEATKIDDELSKLLIGPDAAKTWDNVLKVHEQARLRLRNFRDEEKSLQRQIADVDAVVATLIDGASSEFVRQRLVSMLRRQNWRVPPDDDPDNLAANLIGPFSELVALARQAAELPLSPLPSRSSLARFSQSLNATREQVSADIVALLALEQQINTATGVIERVQEATVILQRARRFIAAGIPGRASERNRLRQSIATLFNQLTGIDIEAVFAVARQHPGISAKAHVARASASSEQAAAALEAIRTEQARLRTTRERSASLTEELQVIALELLNETDSESECPLCHTPFKPGELIAHINGELGVQIDRAGEQVSGRLRQADDAYQTANSGTAVARSIAAFATRAGLSTDARLSQIAAAINNAQREHSRLSRELRTVENDLEQLEREGLHWSDLEPMRVELVKRRFTLNEWSDRSVTELASNIAAIKKEHNDRLAECVRDADRRKRRISTVLGEKIESARQARVRLSNLEQRGASAASLAAKLANLDKQFRIPMNKPLGELSVEAESVRQVAVELQTAIQQEKDNNKLRTQSDTKRTELQQKIEVIAPRIKNLAAATNVLQRLQREHSLHSAMQEAISQNRSAIESIFGQIHAPHEFSGLGQDITTLRRLDGTTANLTEISTGQRAALGLSMFLAQNMKLRFAPPVILIDDPIAHVDDLNCLSFLDYLREIALTKRRQIFFATANDKLAAVFERKFDFLGFPEFQKIVLHRES